ncbi:unnamed protein product, partial [marine sediment metagenome]
LRAHELEDELLFGKPEESAEVAAEPAPPPEPAPAQEPPPITYIE